MRGGDEILNRARPPPPVISNFFRKRSKIIRIYIAKLIHIVRVFYRFLLFQKNKNTAHLFFPFQPQ